MLMQLASQTVTLKKEKKRKKDRYAVEKTITIAFHLNPEATNEGRVELQKTVRLIGPLFNLINYL